jgi:hypothetical protein
MSSRDSKELKPLRHAWSLHLLHDDFYLDEPISGHVELVVQDVYMAASIHVNLVQIITMTVSDKVKKLATAMLKNPVSLLTDAPRTQFCMGRHILPFEFRADVSWSKLDGDVYQELERDAVQSTLEPTPTSSQWMLPTTAWEHAEDVAVYSGTARSASVHVQYVLECMSQCAVHNTVNQVVATKEVPILGSIDPWSLHSPSLVGTYAPEQKRPEEAIKLRAKLNRRTFHHGDTISIHYQISNRFSAPVKEVRFSLLNSAMMRDQSSDSVLPTLHTTSISSNSDQEMIAPHSEVDKTITLHVPSNALPRWSTSLIGKRGDIAEHGAAASSEKSNTKLRFESILRIALILDNFQDHIFQTTLSISPCPRALNIDRDVTVRLDQDDTRSARCVVWVKDREAARCAHCTGVFSFLHRKHHCRGCGLLVCADHSKAIPAPKLFGLKPRRVCKSCEPLIRSGELTGDVPATNPLSEGGLPIVQEPVDLKPVEHARLTLTD